MVSTTLIIIFGHMKNICQDSYSTTVKGSCQDYYKTPAALLQESCQESCQKTVAKMIEYFSLILQCITTIILRTTAYYICSLLVQTSNPPKSEVKRQKAH